MLITVKNKNVINAKKFCKKGIEGYEMVNVLTWHLKDSKYAAMSPYLLKDENGYLFENIWQSAKVFPTAYDIKVKPNFMSNIIWWEYVCDNMLKKECHLLDNVIQPKYYEWKQSILNCPNPIRYPNTFQRRRQVAFSVELDDNGNEVRYNYIDARRKIYFKRYAKLVRQLPLYTEMLNKLKVGQNFCITEVDVPSQDKHGEYGNVDSNGHYTATLESLEKLINNPTYPFGHGLVLCYVLLQDSSVNL